MIPVLLAGFGLAALVGPLSLFNIETDDYNHANDTDDPPEPDPLPGKDCGVDRLCRTNRLTAGLPLLSERLIPLLL